MHSILWGGVNREAHLSQVCDFLLDVFIGSSLNFHLLSHGSQGLVQSISFPLGLLISIHNLCSYNIKLCNYTLNKIMFYDDIIMPSKS